MWNYFLEEIYVNNWNLKTIDNFKLQLSFLSNKRSNINLDISFIFLLVEFTITQEKFDSTFIFNVSEI